VCLQKVTQQLAAGVVMPVRVTGPVGRLTDRTLEHPVLLIFAGGVGVSRCVTSQVDCRDCRLNACLQMPAAECRCCETIWRLATLCTQVLCHRRCTLSSC
jgi:NAD(P)H-flavin reductase